MAGNNLLEENQKNLHRFRFVVLRHLLPTDSYRTNHWDLMLESDKSQDTGLITFELPFPLERVPLVSEVVRLANHRSAYLTFEGDISGNRGSVTQVASGSIQWISSPNSDEVLTARLAGKTTCGSPVVGTLSFRKLPNLENPHWKLESTLAAQGQVIAVASSPHHRFSKETQTSIQLEKGLGVIGDAHAGKTVKHRSRVAQDPNQPNLRQVHLIHSELFRELSQKGIDISPGEMGENITTAGLDLLCLPRRTIVSIGKTAKIEITGLRNPCSQLDSFKPGLLNAVLGRDYSDNLIRKSGIMGIVLASGDIEPGDQINIELPCQPYESLERV
jgi:hypothetical protein